MTASSSVLFVFLLFNPIIFNANPNQMYRRIFALAIKKPTRFNRPIIRNINSKMVKDTDTPSCRGGGCSTTEDTHRQTIMEGYGSIAENKEKSCCGSNKKDVTKEDYAKGLGYSAEDLKGLPEGANMGLSCGNPTAMASLQPGQTVLDLGSGGGFDVFVAARKVGPTGKSLGVDMTPAMVHKARSNAVQFAEHNPSLANVCDFRMGEIEHLPVADASVDVVISNCVINLSPDKAQVWKEIARVLKPGGKACISDIVLLQPLPEQVKSSVSALIGCVAGAIEIDEVVKLVEAVGMTVAQADKDAAFVHNAESSDDPLYKNLMKELPEGTKPGDLVTSLKLTATKPNN